MGMSSAVLPRVRVSEKDYREHSALVWPLQAVIQETVALYELLLRLLTALARRGVDVVGSGLRFADQHHKLRSIYDSVRTVPFLAARVSTLRLSHTAPSFGRDAPEVVPERWDPSDEDRTTAARLGDDLFAHEDASPAMPRRSMPGSVRPSQDSMGLGGADDSMGEQDERDRKLRSMRQELDTLQQEREMLRGTVASLESYLKELGDGLTAVDPKIIAELTGSSHHSAETARSQAEQLKALRKEVARLTAERQALESTAEQRLAEATRQLSELEQRLQAVQHDADLSAAAVTSLQVNNEVVEEEKDSKVERRQKKKS